MKNLKKISLLFLIGIFTATIAVGQSTTDSDYDPVYEKIKSDEKAKLEQEKLEAETEEAEMITLEQEIAAENLKSVDISSIDQQQFDIDNLTEINTNLGNGTISKKEVSDMLSSGEISYKLMLEQEMDQQSELFKMAKTHEKEK
ncbi:MAG TPA: hypothetical protein EYM84_00185 [Flavobacteriales bacterium]|nr:hypothetical protein [Flavobacteriales bacterium]HIN38670.1 hypothetical protein [Flavobacteriales bacterium]